MKVSVICCTYNRPQMLGYLVRCFEKQTYINRELIIVDDAGQYNDQWGDKWRLLSVAKRFPTLGQKRNAATQLATGDVLMQWDDDDLFLPWAISTAVASLEETDADWSRPSIVLRRCPDGTLAQHYTWNRPDQSDKAFQCGWALRREAFWRAGGYPKHDNGEDKLLARRLIKTGATECDPCALGHRPAYIWGPWENLHLSGAGTDGYGNWGKFAIDRATFCPEDPPGLDLENPQILLNAGRRMFAGDWS